MLNAETKIACSIFPGGRSPPDAIEPGMIITLQRGAKKAEFRVEWTKQLAPNELQAGIESLEPQNDFWGIDLSDEFEAKKDMQTLMTALSRCSKPVI